MEIHEYQPGMIHAKILVVDASCSVVGSTNSDSRSFDLNDEVNLAVMDPALAMRLLEDFDAGLAASSQVTYEAWSERSWQERALASLDLVIQRQV